MPAYSGTSAAVLARWIPFCITCSSKPVTLQATARSMVSERGVGQHKALAGFVIVALLGGQRIAAGACVILRIADRAIAVYRKGAAGAEMGDEIIAGVA